MVYCTVDGRAPFKEWVHSLKDRFVQAVITRRIAKLQAGNLGDWKRVGSIIELRVDVGPGYRIYFGEIDRTLVILLVGGDKSSQKRDIITALRYWHDCKTRGEIALDSIRADQG